MSITFATTYLRIRWGISKGRDTYGYNICTITDERTGKRHSCNGGGYDMVGTSFGNWLADTYQDRLVKLARERGPSTEHAGQVADTYGMYHWADDRPVALNGACGLECMLRIAKDIGLEVERTFKPSDRNRGETTGWIITDRGAP